MSDSIRFSLVREEKVVADGVLFKDGAAVLRWRGDNASFQCYESFQSVLDVHHVGRGTGLTWIDGTCFACGAEADFWQGASGNGGQCRRCSATWDGAPSFEQEPEKGVWKEVESG